jgi:hypothetical protein
MVSGKTLLHRCSYQCIADGRVGHEDLRGRGAEIYAWIFSGVVEGGEFVVFAGVFEKKGWLDVVSWW